MKKFLFVSILFLSLTTGFANSTYPGTADVSNLTLIKQDGKLLIQWIKQNLNIAMYELERSEDGKNFKTIALIFTSNDIKNYTYKDKLPTKNIYYRLKEINNVGQFSYTPVQALNQNLIKEDVKIAATTNGKVLIQFNKKQKTDFVVTISTLNGETLTQHFFQPALKIAINAPQNFKSFVITVSNTDNLNISKQIIL